MKDILNQEDIKFLKEIAHELKTQDRKGTNKPVFYQIRDIDMRWDNDESNGFDDVRIYTEDEETLDTLEEMKQYIKNNEEYFSTEDLICTIDELDIDEIISLFEETDAHISFGHEEVILKNTFITLKSAEEHLQSNSHHYSEKVKIYTSYAWRNPTLERLLEIIEKFDQTDSNVPVES